MESQRILIFVLVMIVFLQTSLLTINHLLTPLEYMIFIVIMIILMLSENKLRGVDFWFVAAFCFLYLNSQNNLHLPINSWHLIFGVSILWYLYVQLTYPQKYILAPYQYDKENPETKLCVTQAVTVVLLFICGLIFSLGNIGPLSILPELTDWLFWITIAAGIFNLIPLLHVMEHEYPANTKVFIDNKLYTEEDAGIYIILYPWKKYYIKIL